MSAFRHEAFGWGGCFLNCVIRAKEDPFCECSMIRIFKDRRLGTRAPAARKKAGFTLVEMMVAIGVIGLVLTAAFTNVSQSLQVMETARDYTRVAQILQTELENVRTMSWADLEAIEAANLDMAGVAQWEELDLSDEFHEAFGTRYTAYRRVQPRDGLTDQKEIVIWVTWLNANGSSRSKYTSSWFTENGMNDYYYRSF